MDNLEAISRNPRVLPYPNDTEHLGVGESWICWARGLGRGAGRQSSSYENIRKED